MFAPLNLKWDDKSYSVPADQILQTICDVEEILTLDELRKYQARKTVPLGRVAQAWGIVLRHAGCLVTDEEVYKGLFANGAAGVITSVTGLLHLMLPPPDVLVGQSEVGKSRKTRGGSSSSKTSTKSSSDNTSS